MWIRVNGRGHVRIKIERSAKERLRRVKEMWRGQVKEEDRAERERETEKSKGDVERASEGGRYSGERNRDGGE